MRDATVSLTKGKPIIPPTQTSPENIMYKIEMDSGTTTTVLSYVAIVISVGSIVMGIINHRRLRSNCCGHRAVVSLDIDSTAPAANKEPLKDNPSPV